MDIVLSRRGGVSVRDQIKAQIELKILGGDFKSGQRLPSVRAMARRLKVHANTVSAAYQLLEDAGHLASHDFLAASGLGQGHRVKELQHQVRVLEAIGFDTVFGGQLAEFVDRLLLQLAEGQGRLFVDALREASRKDRCIAAGKIAPALEVSARCAAVAAWPPSVGSTARASASGLA